MGKIDIPKEVLYTISSEHFNRRSNLFTREQGNIMQCILFERPSRLIYPVYFITPLYMPCDVLQLTYGRRVAEITSYRNSESIAADCLTDALQKTVFPLFEQIKTPQLLMEYLLTVQDAAQYFFCPPVRIGMLKAYTSLYLHDRSLFSSMASETEQLLQTDSCFSEAVIAKMRAELKTLQEHAQSSDMELDLFFASIVLSTRALFKK